MIYHRFLILVLFMGCLFGCVQAHGQAESLSDRVAAWQHTIVCIDEKVPNACLSTYVTERASCTDTHLLAKLVVGVGTGENIHWTESPKVLSVQDFPGGIEAVYHLGEYEITTRILPYFGEPESVDRQGSALFEVKCNPAVPVTVKCGEGDAVTMGGRSAILRDSQVGKEGDEALIHEDTGILKSRNHSVIVAVKSTSAIKTINGDKGGTILSIQFPEGKGSMMMGYSDSLEKAISLAGFNPEEAVNEIDNHYENLLGSSWIETPEKVLDEAFRGALITLEYNWLKPYGWIEAIHHWVCMWHMQVTGALGWVGQADRVRESLLAHANHLFPTGAVPQFCPGGFIRRDFGGSNQFFSWQVNQYWKYTGDQDAAKVLYLALKKVIQQTYLECDEDGDLLLRWGAQIGNQEDFIHTPFNGTSPSIEGIQMLKTASQLASVLGFPDEAAAYQSKAQIAVTRLKEQLWQEDLGRFMYYKDPLGLVRPDGQYHTLIYPVIYGLLDPIDSWTSIRHLRDRLTGTDGPVYCSNNFPTHNEMTTGCQAGAAQQPWGAKGLAAVGLRNEVYRPLKAVAEWVMNERLRGTWMEVAHEPVPSHFTPPAGLYMQSVIEDLFGLRVNKPEGILRVLPSFPDAWPSANLVLPEFSAAYQHDGDRFVYTITSQNKLKRVIQWSLPPCRIKEFKINGTEKEYSLTPGVNCVVLSASTASEMSTAIELLIDPFKYNIENIKSVAEGDLFEVRPEGLHILKIEDRSKVLSGYSIENNGNLRATIRKGQLKPYLGYGRLGLLNFSRRSFFLLCSIGEGTPFWVPIDVTVLPRYEAAVTVSTQDKSDSWNIRLLLRNNTSDPVQGSTLINIAGTNHALDVDIPSRTEKNYAINLNSQILGHLSPGENQGTWFVGDEWGVTFKFEVQQEQLASISTKRDERRSNVSFPLQENMLKNDLERPGIRSFRPYDWMGWDQYAPNLSSLVGQSTMTVAEIPGLSFHITENKLIPVSSKTGTSSVTIDLFGTALKKVYLLVIPYLDNHDAFVKVANVSIRTESGAVISRDLFSPGDLDWGSGDKKHFLDWTWSREEPRKNRFDLLPLLDPTMEDWNEGKAPAFPQPEYWSTCLVRRVPSATLNVVELNLPERSKASSLTISVFGADPALGLVAVSGELFESDPLFSLFQRGETAALSRPRRILYHLNQPGNLEGWKTEGNAFCVAAQPGLFPTATLNSLVSKGESATGKATSPEFEIDSPYLTFDLQGGTSGNGNQLTVQLVESSTGKMLHSITPSGTHASREVRIPVANYFGWRVHLEVVDGNPNPTMAWIGISNIALASK